MASLTPVEESQLRDSLRRRLVQLDSQPTTNRRGTNHLLVDLALVGQGWSSMAMDRRAPVQALVFQCFTQHLRTALVPTRLNPVLAFLSYHQDPTGTRPWWPPLAQWIPQQLASSATKPATIRSLLRFLLSCRADWLATPSHTSVRLPETTELRSWVLNYCQECVGLGATTDPTWGHDLEAVALCRKILAHAHLPVILPDAASLSGDMGARLDACRSQLARAMDGQISAELVGLWLAKQLDTVPTKEHKDLLMTVMHLYLWQFPGQLARCQTFLRLALPSDSVIPELDWKARLGSLLFQVLTPTDIAIVERQLVGYIVRVWEHPDDLVPLPDLRPLWQSKRAYWKSNNLYLK
ncbi:hypothetical protein H4R34_004357 [Dimargaris verticillata]|uniref:Uncharacterized protein n=1 Tax=Dimargaris verticillata TaxID=2761393 RepID=A0A9W8EB83_9FUNG|nr:hypothetical protein H4R34_004357 [Dimargaris verticillata]